MIERIKAGMILFIVSESVFFLLLILAYVFYHRAGEGEAAAHSLNVGKTALFSIALFSSSGTVWLSGIERRRRNYGKASLWLLGTIALGAVFLVGQGFEYAGLLRNHITISRNLFGATFFTLTGFHGFHVLMGLVILSVLLGLTMSAGSRRPAEAGAEAVSLYWHFVDGVWVFIFAIVYLWGAL
jgi:heme/copper-type cytochrome/quinol oxidase subunit 3